MITFLPSSVIDFSRAKISSVVLISKFPVGSSAKIMSGSLASALAMATLCCSPPDRLEGNLLACLIILTLFKRLF